MRRTVIKIISFILVFVTMTAFLNKLLRPVFYFDEWAAPSSTYSAFYNMEKNSLDVLFLGNSHSYTSFSPQIIYDRNGITSYNLASGLQSTFISYYWLKEALTRQSPKVVVLEISPCVLDFIDAEPLAMSETYIRRNLDYMKLSRIKLQAAKEVCRYDPGQSVLSYLIPLLRYHSRWKVISEEDYLSFNTYKNDGLFGYSMDIIGSCNTDAGDYSIESEEVIYEMHPIMEEYLVRITELCKENGITLILVTTPSTGMNPSKHKAIENYSKQNDLVYIDYNEHKYYTAIGYDFAADNGDPSHPNVWGGIKLSSHMGDILSEIPGMTHKTNVKIFEENREKYESRFIEAQLRRCTDIKEYFLLIEKERYAIFVTENLSNEQMIPPEVKNALLELNPAIPDSVMTFNDLHFTLNCDDDKFSYDSDAVFQGTFRNGAERYCVKSGSSCTVEINDKQYIRSENGLQIVLYDLEQYEVIDYICCFSSVRITVSCFC